MALAGVLLGTITRKLRASQDLDFLPSGEFVPKIFLGELEVPVLLIFGHLLAQVGKCANCR